MSERYSDVVIIGGGIMGTSLARELTRRGAGKVMLLERHTIAFGGSGRTGALLRRHYSNVPEATLAHRGWEIYANFPEIVGGEPVHTNTGLVVTVDTSPACEENIEKLRRNVALQNAVGIPSRVVTPEELHELQPFADWSDVRVAAYEHNSGYVDSVTATRGMARAAAREGAIIREGVRVLGIETDGTRVTGVRTAEGVIPAGTVVVAAGPWINQVLAGSGVTLPIETLRVQVAILHRPLELEQPHFVYLDTAAGIFCRPWAPGRTMIGVGGGDQHDACDPDDYLEQNDAGYPQLAIDAISKRIPAMAGASYLTGQVGMYDMSPDTHPLLGAVGPDGLQVMTGFSGAGFKKGPAIAEAMSDLMLTGRCDWVDMHPFRPGRFDEPGYDPNQPWTDTEYVFSSDFGHRL
ncbi:MAG: NAD(P)/FAD-dependent oxidoreductase [Thermomicrobiales bacterium]